MYLLVYSTVGCRRTGGGGQGWGVRVGGGGVRVGGSGLGGGQGSSLAHHILANIAVLFLFDGTILNVQLCRAIRLSVHYSVHYGFRSYLQKSVPKNW